MRWDVDPFGDYYLFPLSPEGHPPPVTLLPQLRDQGCSSRIRGSHDAISALLALRPYKVFYQVIGQRIVIFRVLHAKQDQGPGLA